MLSALKHSLIMLRQAQRRQIITLSPGAQASWKTCFAISRLNEISNRKLNVKLNVKVDDKSLDRSLVSFLRFLLSALYSFQLHDCILSEEDAGKNRGHGLQVRDEKKQTWCWYTGRYNTQEKRKRGKKQHSSQFVQDQKKRGECKCLMWFGRVSCSGCAPTELKAAL